MKVMVNFLSSFLWHSKMCHFNFIPSVRGKAQCECKEILVVYTETQNERITL